MPGLDQPSVSVDPSSLRGRGGLRRWILPALLLIAGPVLDAQVWTGTFSGTWSTAGNWSGGVPGAAATATFNSNTANDPNLTAAATAGRLLFNSGSDAEIFTGAALTLNGVSGVGIDNQSGVTQTFNNTLVVNAAQTWNAASGNLAFGAVTLSNNLTLTGSSAFSFGGTLLNNGGNRTFTNNASGAVTVTGGVSLSNNNTGRTLTFDGSGTTTVSGAIGNGGTSAGNLVKTGSGTLILSGANTYTGATTVGTAGGATGGTLQLGAANALPGATVTVFAGTLDLNGNNDTIGALNVGGGGAGTSANVTTGAGTLTLGGNVTYSATNNPNGATIAGTVDLGGAGRTFTVNDSSAAPTDLTVSADITGANRNLAVTGAGNALLSGDITTGSGTLTKSGTGTLTLSGTNTYTGATSVTGGVLNVQNASALGTTAAGTSVSAGAALQLEGGVAVGTEALTLSGSGVGGTGALRNIAGANSWSGNITLNADTTLGSDAGSLTVTGGISGTNRTLTLTGAGDLSLGTISTGSGALVKNGTGTATLNGAATYTGATTINAGTLQLGAANVIADSSAVTVAAGATFAVNGQTETIASLAGAGTVDLGSGALTTAGNASTTFAGTLAGTGDFTKAGTGTLTLANSFTFDGTFNLNAGTLLLSDIALSLGTLNITGNSFLDFGGTAASLTVANFTIAAGVTLTIQNWANATDFFFAQNWTGAAFNVTGATPMNQITFTGFSAADTKWQGYDSQITPVPEPSAYGAVLLGLGGALVAWRRRARP